MKRLVDFAGEHDDSVRREPDEANSAEASAGVLAAT